MSACRALGASLQRKRGYLQKQLEEVGFRVLPAQGTYFLVADIRQALHDGPKEPKQSPCKTLMHYCGKSEFEQIAPTIIASLHCVWCAGRC